MTEDLDPIETAIDWLRFVLENGRISPHDVDYVRDTVIPQALTEYAAVQQQLKESKF
jgi:hypothetical protein